MDEARVFQALSDPTRLKIMSLLGQGPMNVSGMVRRLRCAQPAVSRHLRVLKDVALISDRRKGKEVEYSLNLDQLGGVTKYMQDLLDRAYASGSRGSGRTARVRPTAKGKEAAREAAAAGHKTAARRAEAPSTPRPSKRSSGKTTPQEQPQKRPGKEAGYVIERDDEPMDDFLL